MLCNSKSTKPSHESQWDFNQGIKRKNRVQLR